MVGVEPYVGEEILPLLDGLAELRIQVFREWPYLYEGSADYEKHYLQQLAASPGAVVVGVHDNQDLVGASTALPLEDVEPALKRPFSDPTNTFYLAESVLLPGYRGQGLGRRFFELREDHARRLGGFDKLCFCAVERPPNHPARPKNFRTLEPFWRRLGFVKQPELVTRYHWTDVGHSHETEKPMVYWTKQLT